MKELKEFCSCIINNEECAVIKIDDGHRLDLIALGCFTGDEEMYRITKGGHHTITEFRTNGTSYSWEFGSKGTTMVSDCMNQKRCKVMDCLELDLGIAMDSKNADIKEAPFRESDITGEHTLKVMEMSSNCNCAVRVDDVFFRSVKGSIDNVIELFAIHGWEWTQKNEYQCETGARPYIYEGIIKKGEI